MLNERFSLKLNGANVFAHFTAKPQAQTIRRYAAVLEMTDDEVQVVERGVLDDDRLRHWEHKVFRLLRGYIPDEFKPGAVQAVKDALGDAAVRTQVLTATALSPHEVRYEFSYGLRRLPLELQPFAAAISPYLDLRDFLRERQDGEEALWTIYSEAARIYGNHEKALAFVDACAAILKLDGFDTRPMYDRMRKIMRGIRRRWG
jgi:hypothetical protein